MDPSIIDTPVPNDSKVLVIGWDAADWRAIRPLIEQGKMPHLERMVAQGVHGNASTLCPILSPMLWTSITTGKRPSKHGIWGFSELTPDGKGITPITNASRQCKAIWNILSQVGKNCNVVGFWPSHPAEPIRGVMVSNWYQQSRSIKGWKPKSFDDKPTPGVQGWTNEQWDMASGAVHPARLEASLREFRFHPSELDASQISLFVPEFAELEKKKDPRLITLAKILCDATSIHGAVTALMQLEPWDFTAVYYDAIDHFGHGFMKYHPPKQKKVSDEDFRIFKGVVEAGYRFHDLMLGVLLELAGPETNVILLSDHGFHPDHLRPENIPDEPAGPAIEHRPLGIFVAKGPAFKQNSKIVGASIIDLTPTVLQLFDLPVGQDMDGKVLTEIFHTPPTTRRIPTWENVTGPFDDGRHKNSAILSQVQQQEMLRQLIDLGYIEEPNDDASQAVQETTRELKYNLAISLIDEGNYSRAIELLKPIWDQWPMELRFGIHLIIALGALLRWDEQAIEIEHLVARAKEGREWATQRYAQIEHEWQDLIQRKQAKESSEGLETSDRKGEESTQDQEKTKPLSAVEEKRFSVLSREMRRIHRLSQPIEQTVEWMNIQRLLSLGIHEDIEVRLEPYLKACDENPDSSLLSGLGRSLLLLGKYEVAEKLFTDLDRIDNENLDAKLGLAHVYLAQGKSEQSAEMAVSAIELKFADPRGHIALAKALSSLSEIDLAINSYDIALRLAPSALPIRLEKIDLLQQAGRLDQAALERAQYERLMAQSTKTLAARTSIDPLVSKESRRADLGLHPGVETPKRCSMGSDCVTVVSGLPRSGTSLMMQMLTSAGLETMIDDARPADDNNPLGFFEDKRVMGLANSCNWIPEARGKAIKVVAPLLKYLPEGERYRIIFMDRDLRSVVKSQRRMLERLGRKGSSLGEAELIEKYSEQIYEVERLIADRKDMEVIFVDYDQLIDNPKRAAKTVAVWIDKEELDDSMAAAVHSELRHHESCS